VVADASAGVGEAADDRDRGRQFTSLAVGCICWSLDRVTFWSIL